MIKRAKEDGIHLVPTGYKGSNYANIEWRFSFSGTELNLVHTWPNTLKKCYFLLKLLKKTITIQAPSLVHALSSYHIKTALFWLVEETGVEYWVRHSMSECLMHSLEHLLKFVDRGCIPHYFLKDNNLFDAEAGTSRQD